MLLDAHTGPIGHNTLALTKKLFEKKEKRGAWSSVIRQQHLQTPPGHVEEKKLPPSPFNFAALATMKLLNSRRSA